MPYKTTARAIIITLVNLLLFLSFGQQTKTAYASVIHVDGSCTLQDAIRSANMNVAVGNCTAGSGSADTIILDIDVLLTAPYAPSTTFSGSQAGLPDITSTITIQAGTGTKIGSNGANFRLFNVMSSGNLTFENVILEGATVATTDHDIARGAAIYNEGTLHLQNTTLRNNIADGRNMRYQDYEGANGGAIYNAATGILSTDGSIFIGNIAYGAFNIAVDNGNNAHGGALYNAGIVTEINNTSFDSNLAQGLDTIYGGSGIFTAAGGGAIYNFGTINILRNSTLSNNISTNHPNNFGAELARGGAIYNEGDIVDAHNLTFSGNQALGNNGNLGFGAGIFVEIGSVGITHSTFMNNFAEGGGEDIYVYRGMVTVDNSLLASNSPTGNCVLESNLGALTGTNNLHLTSDQSCSLLSNGTIEPGADIDLTLRNNGGITQTHALVNSGSNPAVDAIPTCGLATDQRGVARDANCDVGSYEMEAIAMTPTPTMTPSPTATATALPGGELVVDGVCTLFDAIIAANTDTPFGNCPAGQGADTILLDVDTFLITDAYPYSMNIVERRAGLPDIRSDITIEARSASLISGNSSNFRIFHIWNTGNLTLRGVTVTGGRVLLGPYDNEGRGGAIEIATNGVLTLENSIITNNSIDAPDGSPSTTIRGGVIYNGGTLVATNTLFSDNHIDIFVDDSAPQLTGGVIHNAETGRMTLKNTQFNNNSIKGIYASNHSYAHGGAIFNEGHITEITDSSFSDNWIETGGHNTVYQTKRSLANGGAISNLGTISAIQNTAFINNQVRPDPSTIRLDFVMGGAIYNSGAIFNIEGSVFADNKAVGGNEFSAYGGAVANEGSIYMLRNSTFSNNSADGEYKVGVGGALYIDQELTTLEYLTFVDNYASSGGDAIYLIDSTLLIDASIFANPRISADCSGVNSVFLGTDNLSLVSETSCVSIVIGNIELETHLEGQLKNNGGLTNTHALVNIPSNPAIDVVAGCTLATDQRGEPRDTNCDVGAYEVQGSQPAPTPTIATYTPTTTLTPTVDISPTPTQSLTPTPTPTDFGIPADTVRINELTNNSSGGDYFELYNYNTSPAFLENWQVVVNNQTYIFGQVQILPNSYIIVKARSGTDTPNTIYTHLSYGWYNGGSISLLDNNGVGIDFVKFGNSTTNPPAGTDWVGPAITHPGIATLGRDSVSTDTDSAHDWCLQSATPLNPNTDCYYVLINEVRIPNQNVVELYNPKPFSVDLTGWRLKLYDTSNTLKIDFDLTGIVMPANSYMSFYEGNGTNTANRIYLGTYITWTTGGAITLSNATTAVDFVKFGSSTISVPAGTTFVGSPVPIGTGYISIGRNANHLDTGNNLDWCTQNPSLNSQNGDCISIWITEIYPTSSKGIELRLYNGRDPIDLSNWQLHIYDDNGALAIIYDFPVGALLDRLTFYEVREGTGVDNLTKYVYLGQNLPWTDAGAVALVYDGNQGIDYVEFGNINATPPNGTTWVGDSVSTPPAYRSIGRFSYPDTDSADDWCIQAETLGTGGSTCGGVVINEVDTNETEAIEIYNYGESTIDLDDNWYIAVSDDVQTVVFYSFFDTLTLAPGEYAILYEGTGTDTANTRYLGTIFDLDVGGSILLDNSNNINDAVCFGIVANDYCNWGSNVPPAPSAGQSLGRNSVSTDADHPLDWCAELPSLGGQNSLCVTPNPTVTPTLTPTLTFTPTPTYTPSLTPTLAPPDIVVDGVCTLIDAIIAANTDAPSGNCTRGWDDDDTIILDVDTNLTEAYAGSTIIDFVQAGLPDITSGMTILARNGSIINGNNTNFRIFNIMGTGGLTLDGVTVSGGNAPESKGGGIVMTEGGYFRMTNSVVTNNSARFGGGLYLHTDIDGVANATIIIENSVISYNIAVQTEPFPVPDVKAGGFYISGGGAPNYMNLTFRDSVVYGNLAKGADAITNQGGNATGGGGVIAINSSSQQYNNYPALLTRTTFYDNTAQGGNSILQASGQGSGGGLYITGHVNINNITVSNNHAISGSAPIYTESVGGGIYIIGTGSYLGTLSSSTFLNNTADRGEAISENSSRAIVNNIFASSGPNPDCDQFTLIVPSFNIYQAGDSSCDEGGLPIQIGTDIDPVLQFNGGLTQTHALINIPNNPAIDNMFNCGVTIDQRGEARDSFCDAGAYEVTSIIAPTLTPTFTPSDTPTYTPSYTPSLTPSLTPSPTLTSTPSPTGIIVDGNCTLIDAIIAANTDAPSGNCLAGYPGLDVITLDVDTTLTQPYSLSPSIGGGQSGLPDIASPIHIVARNGHVISANNTDFRIFYVTLDTQLTLEGVTLQNGRIAPANDPAFGGAIYTELGSTLTLIDCIVTNNAIYAGATVNTPGLAASGGGIYTLGNLSMTRSIVTNNLAIGGTTTATNGKGGIGQGGGIYAAGNIPLFVDNMIDQNQAIGANVSGSNATGGEGHGAGLFNSGTAVMRRNTFSFNIADGGTGNLLGRGLGAGIYNQGNLTVINSTFSANESLGSTGVGNAPVPQGGGIYNYNGTVNINHTTFLNNKHGAADSSVGGTAGSTTIVNNSILFNCDQFTTGNNNLGTCSQANSSPITVGVDISATLANNGGPTQTHALFDVVGNPAIDASPNCGLTVDQRGVGRDSNCDIGSFEHASASIDNDFIVNSLTLASFPDSIAQSNVQFATTSASDPILWCAPAYTNSIWYQYTPSSDELLVANTIGSDFDTVLGIFTGTEGALNILACDNDNGGAGTSRTQMNLKAGMTYSILLAHSGTTSLSAPSTSVLNVDTQVANSGLVLFDPDTADTTLIITLADSPLAPDYVSFTNTPPTSNSPEWVMGDWNGDGVRTPGYFDSGVFHYTNDIGPNTNWSTGMWLGNPSSRKGVVAGRFANAFGNDCIGWIDGNTSSVTGDLRFSLKYWCDMTASGAVPLSAQWLGSPLGDSRGFSGTYQFIYGDWDSDGLAEPGIRRSSRIVRSDTAPAEGAATYPTGTAQRWDTADGDGPGGHGLNDGLFVAGDWNGNGQDTWGVVYDDDTFYYRDVFGFNPGPFEFASQTFVSTVSAPRQVSSHGFADGGSSLPGPALPNEADESAQDNFLDTSHNAEANLQVSKSARYADGEIGLTGDSIIWTILITNTGTAPAINIQITDDMPVELRIDDVVTDSGTIAIKGQVITIMFDRLDEHETARIEIITTILKQPFSGTVVNNVHVHLPEGNGTNIDADLIASGTIEGVSILPTTGYHRHFRW